MDERAIARVERGAFKGAVEQVLDPGGAGGVLPEDAAGNFSWFLGRHFAIMYIACECKRPMASYERRI